MIQRLEKTEKEEKMTKKKALTIPDDIKEDVQGLKEYITSYFSRPKPPGMLWESFEKEQMEMQNQFLKDPESLVSMLENSPYYVAIAFFLKVKFKDNELVDKMMRDYKSVSLPDLQAAKCVEVGKSIRPLLDALLKRPEHMKVFALCAFAERAKGLKLPPHP